MIDSEILAAIMAVWATIATIFGSVATYLWYRRKEVVKFAFNMYVAAKDGKVDEKEFQDIADLFGAVLYKK